MAAPNETIHAVIQNGIVVNIIVADAAWAEENYPGSVDITGMNPEPGIGWSYDGTTFTPPVIPPPEPTPPPTQFSTQGFRARYTKDELITVDNYADFPGISDSDRQLMLSIQTSIMSASIIDITAQNVIDAVNDEARIGLITTQRAAEILDPNSLPPTGERGF